jgi:hypothetical protein
MRRAVLAAFAAILIGAAVAPAARSITKHQFAILVVPAGATRAVDVPYPDALEYGNARYQGSVRLAVKPIAAGRRPDLARVRILEAQSVEGGSAYRVRAHNGNAPGSAPVRVTATATTIEPLPHS